MIVGIFRQGGVLSSHVILIYQRLQYVIVSSEWIETVNRRCKPYRYGAMFGE